MNFVRNQECALARGASSERLQGPPAQRRSKHRCRGAHRFLVVKRLGSFMKVRIEQHRAGRHHARRRQPLSGSAPLAVPGMGSLPHLAPRQPRRIGPEQKARREIRHERLLPRTAQTRNDLSVALVRSFPIWGERQRWRRWSLECRARDRRAQRESSSRCGCDKGGSNEQCIVGPNIENRGDRPRTLDVL